MKKHQKGFAAGVLVTIIAFIAAVGGGYYFLQTEKAQISESSITQGSDSQKDVPSTPAKSTVKITEVSQNASDVAKAQSDLEKVKAAYQNSGYGPGKKLVITAPTVSNILEPDKPVTVVFSPVPEATSYEITITKPSFVNGVNGLLSPDKVDTLFKEVTTETVHIIIVPKTNSYETTENSYNGEVLVVKALDKNGNQLKESITYQGKQYEVPILDQRQIKILASPSQPDMLSADRYVLEKEGGTVLLTFGALRAPYVKRKVMMVCPSHINQMLSIDGVACDRLKATFLEFKSEAFTKNLIVKGNTSSDRDTAAAVRVQYYDKDGKELNDTGLDDESWISIKIKK